MRDRMVSITEALEETRIPLSTPTFTRLVRSDEKLRGRKFGDKWYVPLSAVYERFGLTGSFGEKPVKDRMLSRGEFAKLAGISEPTLRKMIKSGKLPIGVQFEGSRIWMVGLHQASDWLGLKVNFEVCEDDEDLEDW